MRQYVHQNGPTIDQGYVAPIPTQGQGKGLCCFNENDIGCLSVPSAFRLVFPQVIKDWGVLRDALNGKRK